MDALGSPLYAISPSPPLTNASRPAPYRRYHSSASSDPTQSGQNQKQQQLHFRPHHHHPQHLQHQQAQQTHQASKKMNALWNSPQPEIRGPSANEQQQTLHAVPNMTHSRPHSPHHPA
eukprot:CAMPEP_0197035558 /NCGR_PEP_ID=MMETSP1384-20130603/13324_1 /TAXON_ID=29189 /ORGANISM="Ammonia sp." /LENGTH=117 /DNA_ID=CAMNT_0042465635 /DNA_START=84 /DNA_END=433 /DNA_ORIENTATION=+